MEKVVYTGTLARSLRCDVKLYLRCNAPGSILSQLLLFRPEKYETTSRTTIMNPTRAQSNCRNCCSLCDLRVADDSRLQERVTSLCKSTAVAPQLCSQVAEAKHGAGQRRKTARSTDDREISPQVISYQDPRKALGGYDELSFEDKGFSYLCPLRRAPETLQVCTHSTV